MNHTSIRDYICDAIREEINFREAAIDDCITRNSGWFDKYSNCIAPGYVALIRDINAAVETKITNTPILTEESRQHIHDALAEATSSYIHRMYRSERGELLIGISRLEFHELASYIPEKFCEAYKRRTFKHRNISPVQETNE